MSEYAAPSTTTYDPLRTLLLQDHSIRATELTISLKASKTDQFRSGQLVTVAGCTSPCCPVQAMSAYLRVRQGSSALPLFLLESGQFLSRLGLTTTLRSLLASLGMPSTSYSSHSFRIGAATSAAVNGLPAWLIQHLGRWRSNCSSQYVRSKPVLFQTVSRVMSTGAAIFQRLGGSLAG